jgi:hypothetical protein
VVFVDHDDVIHRDALEAIADHIDEHPGDEVIYTDEHTIDDAGGHIIDYRKPDYSPERLLGQNYFCHVVTMRRDLVERVGRLDPEFEPFTDNDFNLRAVELARSVGHVPRILYSWRATPGSVALAVDEKSGAARSVVAATEHALERRRRAASVRTVPGHDASVLVTDLPVTATNDALVVDDDTSPAAIDEFLRESTADVVVLRPGAADAPDGWSDPLITLCSRADVAVVGPRLVTTDGRLISAGRVHAPEFGDPFQGIDADNPGPWGAFLVTREVSSVSPIGPVLDRRAAVDAGGFDLLRILETAGADPLSQDSLDAASADVDVVMAVLCTALWARGHKTLWSPLATVHLPPRCIADEGGPSQRSDLHRRVAEVYPAVGDERYSPIGSPEGA